MYLYVTWTTHRTVIKMCSVNQIKNYNLAKLKGEFLKRYVPLDPCSEFILKKEMDTQSGADRVAHVIKMLFIIKKKNQTPQKPVPL